MNVYLLLLGSLQTLGGAQIASTRFHEWNYVCMPGAFQACTSVSVYTAYDPTTETTAFRLRIANLQGAESWLPNPGRYSVQGISFNNLDRTRSSLWPDPYGVPHNTRLNWQANGGVPGPFEPFIPNELTGSPWDLNLPFFRASYTLNGGLWGCDGPVPRPYQVTWMCGGYLEYTFFFAGRWELTDASALNVGFLTTEGTFTECSTATDCVTVTPEPVTLILLGTGIAGLGGIQARRRRRQAA